MRLESLANELLLDLFDYLATITLLQAFDNLNERFNQLLLIKTQRYYLDFRCISKNEFTYFCQKYLLSINDRVISLHLSDDIETSNQIQTFFSYGYSITQFNYLQSLSIDYIESFDLLYQITFQCRQLPSLTKLSITLNNNQDREEHFRDFIHNIWSLAKLTHCYLDITYPHSTWLLQISVISPSIKYLSLKNKFYDSNILSHLFEYTPNLQQLYINQINHLNISHGESIFPSLSSLNITLKFSFLYVTDLFQKLPNLSYLTIEFINNPLDGQQLENILMHSLQNLKIFRFKMVVEFTLAEDFEEQVDKLLNTFRSDYWIREYQWFVQCDWYSTDFNRNGLVYTLPYAFKTLDYYDCCQSKSTNPNLLNDSSYNQVERLYHIDREKTLHQNWIEQSNSIRFINIRSLTIKLPFHETFWSTIPVLNRLISLHVTFNQNFSYYQLQILLDRAPRLYLLRFSTSKSFLMESFNINSTSIRRLEFSHDSEYQFRYFNNEECTVLARSSLASQCQVLLIAVANQRDILELIQTMPNLRILNVHCKSAETNENVIEWIQNHLLSRYTCSILRNSFYTPSMNLLIEKIS